MTTSESPTSTSKPPKPKPKPNAGVVLGPDRKPCKPCTAFRNWNPTSNAKKDTGGTSSAMAAFAFGPGAGAGNSNENGASTADGPPAHCPADVEQLGRATWTFLHTTAAYYPDTPSHIQQSSMLSLLHSLPTLYPCSHCASHLGACMRAPGVTPVQQAVRSRGELSLWLCQRHNEVNERLGKGLFDCGRVDERWRDGPADGSCD